MKNHFKLFSLFIQFLCLSLSLSSVTWTQTTKSDFNVGTHDGTCAKNESIGNEDLQLATTIYNGWFNEDVVGSYDGWEDASMGNGTITNNIVDAAGRTSVSYNYATYSAGASWAKKRQYVFNELDNLNRFHLDVYPISGQCSGTAKLKVRVQAYNDSDNPLLNTDDPSDEIEYILYGAAHPTSTFDWSGRTYADMWNNFTWNMKDHIIYFLNGSYNWSDVAYIKLTYESYSGNTSGSTCGAYWDAFFAADFVDDDFDDDYINPSKWIEHEGQLNITEQNTELRFSGTSQFPYWSWSYLKTQETVNHASHRYTETSIKVKLEDLSGDDSIFMFMLEDNDEQNHFRIIAIAGMGYEMGWREDGIWFESTEIIPFLGIEDDTYLTWRIIYDNDSNLAYGLVNGTLIGFHYHPNPLNNYRIKICYDVDHANESIDIRVDDFAFLKYDEGEFDKKYPETGTFVSSAHDTGFTIPVGAGFNTVSWNANGEHIKFRIRTADTEADLQNAVWFGPENDPSGWYETSPFEINPVHDNSRWIQYQAELYTSDLMTTPLLNDITFDYYDAVGITFTFENAVLTEQGNFFEFDVMASASETGTKLGDNSVYINYDAFGFGENIIGNGHAEITKGTLLEGEMRVPLYEMILFDETPSMFSVQSLFNPLALPSQGNDLPAAPTQLLHLKIEIADSEQCSGLSFEEIFMDQEQYYSDNYTKYTPVTAIDTDETSLSCTPQKVKIRIMGENVVLFWEPVAGASFYNVYSSPDAYIPLNEWQLEPEGTEIPVPFWDEPVPDWKKFYFVTAVCE